MKTYTILSLAAACIWGVAGLHAESTDPKLVEGAMPAYPEHARVHNVEGTVVIEVLVDETGHVTAADVVESVTADLDKAALAAIDNWTFEPALEDGKPVMKVVRVPVQFTLLDPAKESLLQARDRALVGK